MRNMIKRWYYNGAVEGLITLAFLMFAVVCSLFKWYMFGITCMAISVLSYCVWVISVLWSHGQKHLMFVCRKTPFGTFINQNIKGKFDYYEIKKRFKEDFNNLPNGTYITLTHETIRKLIETAANESGRKVEILKSEPAGKGSLYAAQREISKHTGHKRPFKLSLLLKRNILMTGYIVRIS